MNKTLQVEIIYFDDVPENIRPLMPDNGAGLKDANYLKVGFGENVLYYSDAMESEDAQFTRDLGWVKKVIQIAYLEGRKSVTPAPDADLLAAAHRLLDWFYTEVTDSNYEADMPTAAMEQLRAAIAQAEAAK